MFLAPYLLGFANGNPGLLLKDAENYLYLCSGSLLMFELVLYIVGKIVFLAHLESAFSLNEWSRKCWLSILVVL